MRVTRIGVPLLLTCLALPACGTGEPMTEPDPDPVPTVTVAPSTPPAAESPSGGATVSTAPQTPGPPEDLPTSVRGGTPGAGKSTGSSRPMTLTGAVEAGVEHDCYLLDGYLLVGGSRDLIRPGARLSVTGHVQADLMTTCQQGTPFMVQRVEPA
ncbi:MULTISPECIES: hypothetical protein [unclassified Micromonospora]|uniref:hypothetical protein n=1 Tax=unclassified Micromonospora TaxID=2617518 RepID=UPI003A88C12D